MLATGARGTGRATTVCTRTTITGVRWISRVLKPHEVEVEQLVFGQPQRHPRGGARIPMVYGKTNSIPNKNTLKVQTPLVRLPFGLSKFGDFSTSAFRLALSLETNEGDQQHQQAIEELKDMIRSVEERTRKEAQDQAEVWFDYRQSPEVLQATFKSSLRQVDKYPPLISLRIPMFQDHTTVEVYYGQEEAKLDALQPNCQVVAIIEPRSVWIVNHNWGIVWNAVQIKLVHKPPLTDYAFIDTTPIILHPESEAAPLPQVAL